MNVSIRKANIKDLAKVQELNNRLFELEYKVFDDTLNVGWTYENAGEKYFKDMIENEVVFLAMVNDNIVGYLAGIICKTSYIKSKLSEIDNMFVLEDYRKKGVGQKLIEEFKKHSVSKGVDSIKVTASAKNKNAILFYIKNGFKEWNVTFRCKL